MKHWGNNVLCAIDVETTGLNPLKHDIIEIAIVPLGFDLERSKQFKHIHMILRPENPEAADKEAVRVAKLSVQSDFSDIDANEKTIQYALNNGICAFRAADIISEWFENMRLKPRCRLLPLAHNWVFDQGFIKAWLGEATYDYIFDPRYIDTMVLAGYFNDLAEGSGQNHVPYPKRKLSSLCARHNIENEMLHNALDDALATAQVYKSMVFHSPVGVHPGLYK